jgi:hypothetical protein
MTTAVVQIGNSDDKLTQREWSQFVLEVGNVIDSNGCHRHFSGGSSPKSPWQNYCYVFEAGEPLNQRFLKLKLAVLAGKYRQDSIAMTIGPTEFIVPGLGQG